MNDKLNESVLNVETTVSKDEEFGNFFLAGEEFEPLDFSFPEEEEKGDSIQSNSIEVENVLKEEAPLSEENSFDSFTISEKTIEDYSEQIDLEELRLDTFISSTSSPVSKSSSVEKGVLSIIFAPTGKRITFDQSLINDLGIDNIIQIGYNDSQLLIGSNLGSQYKNRKLKKQKLKSVLYDAALIKELIKQFTLDYKDVTSRTFDEVSFKQVQGNKVALITIQNK